MDLVAPNGFQNFFFWIWDTFWDPFGDTFGILGGVGEVIWEPFGDLLELVFQIFRFFAKKGGSEIC